MLVQEKTQETQAPTTQEAARRPAERDDTTTDRNPPGRRRGAIVTAAVVTLIVGAVAIVQHEGRGSSVDSPAADPGGQFTLDGYAVAEANPAEVLRDLSTASTPDGYAVAEANQAEVLRDRSDRSRAVTSQTPWGPLSAPVEWARAPLYLLRAPARGPSSRP
ncbi:MAG: hypothetical protein ACR2O6_03710 [Ilumatobacteraceae bacterium]